MARKRRLEGKELVQWYAALRSLSDEERRPDMMRVQAENDVQPETTETQEDKAPSRFENEVPER
jgi:hypothetical protein